LTKVVVSVVIQCIAISFGVRLEYPGVSMGMSFLWESHRKRPRGWDGTGINCYGVGMGQIHMSHEQPWEYLDCFCFIVSPMH